MYSDRVVNILKRTKECGQKHQHCHYGPEHLLKEVLSEPSDLMGKLAKSMSLSWGEIENDLENFIKPSKSPLMKNEVVPSPRLIAALEYAADEAEKCNLKIDDYHLIVGILLEGDNVASRVLQRRGVTVNRLRLILKKVESESFSNSSTSTPMLNRIGMDLNAMALNRRLQLIGREKEVDRSIRILSRFTRRNILLLGEPGVGKTKIVEGLAERIVHSLVPQSMVNKRIISLNIASLVAGTKYRGEFEERLRRIVEETINDGNIILFIDEFHTLIGAGSAEGGVDAANILKPPLARGDLQLIGATTLDEYQNYVEKDPALKRRMQPIYVNEPSEKETEDILFGIRPLYENHHEIKIRDEAIRTAIRLSNKYIKDRFQPDKSIDLVDEAAAYVKMNKTPCEAEVTSMDVAKIFTESTDTIPEGFDSAEYNLL